MKCALSGFLLTAVVVGQPFQPPQAPARARSTTSTVIIRDSRPYLGVAVMELEKGRGVEVKYVEDGSPAAKAGVKPDDIVLEFNGHPVENNAQFARMVAETTPGTKATLSLTRAGAPLTLTLVLQRRTLVNFTIPPVPPMPPIPPTVIMPDLPRPTMFWRIGVLGIETEALNPQMAEYFGVKQGVLIRQVNRQSASDKAGLKAGDVIVRAAGISVAETRDLTGLLRDRRTITLSVMRNRKEVNLEVNLDGS